MRIHVLCLSEDIPLLGYLTHNGYDVRYLPKIENMAEFSDFIPDILIVDLPEGTE